MGELFCLGSSEASVRLEQLLSATGVESSQLGLRQLELRAHAARATIAVIRTRHPGGIYNIVDDEPVAAGTWTPAMAEAVGAAAP
jgi:hypothetical protein